MSEKSFETKTLISKYALGLKQLDKAPDCLVESQPDLARAPEKWTIRQIVHHIVDMDDLWKSRIKAALANSVYTMDLSWYILDNKCAEPLACDTRSLEDVIKLFKASRKHKLQY